MKTTIKYASFAIAAAMLFGSCASDDDMASTSPLTGQAVNFNLAQTALQTKVTMLNFGGSLNYLKFWETEDQMLITCTNSTDNSTYGTQYATYELTSSDKDFSAYNQIAKLRLKEPATSGDNVYTQSAGAITWGSESTNYQFRSLYPTSCIKNFNASTFNPEGVAISMPGNYSVNFQNLKFDLSDAGEYKAKYDGLVMSVLCDLTENIKYWTVCPYNNCPFWGTTAMSLESSNDLYYTATTTDVIEKSDVVNLAYQPMFATIILNLQNVGHDKITIKKIELLANGIEDANDAQRPEYQLWGDFTFNMINGTLTGKDARDVTAKEKEIVYTFDNFTLEYLKTTDSYGVFSTDYKEVYSIVIPFAVFNEESSVIAPEDLNIKITYMDKKPDATSEAEMTAIITSESGIKLDFHPNSVNEINVSFAGHTVLYNTSDTMNGTLNSFSPNASDTGTKDNPTNWGEIQHS